jgi:hypothetical protein
MIRNFFLNYLGVTLENKRDSNKQKARIKAKDSQTSVVTQKFLVKIPDIGLELPEYVYEMITESKMMYGVQVWGLEEVWKETDKIHERFCKKLIRMPRFEVNGVAKLELGMNSRRGKVLCAIVKYLIRIRGAKYYVR